MSIVDLTPILNSPQLPDIVATLNRHLRAEGEVRHRFYNEMSEEQKVEFIEGNVVLHSPAINRHMAAQFMLAKLLDTYTELHRLGNRLQTDGVYIQLVLNIRRYIEPFKDDAMMTTF